MIGLKLGTEIFMSKTEAEIIFVSTSMEFLMLLHEDSSELSFDLGMKGKEGGFRACCVE